MSWWNPFKNKKSKPKDISYRFLIIGIGLLLMMRYRPKGLIPEKINVKKF